MAFIRNLIKLVVVLAFVGGLALGASYLGARATSGKLLGPKPPNLGVRTARFAYKGVPTLPGNPKVWEFTYNGTAVPGARKMVIYISPTGKLIATIPRDIDLRIQSLEAKNDQ